MKIAVYPGSFNPWHSGHQDIVLKALQVFDQVVIARGINPLKPYTEAEEDDFLGATARLAREYRVVREDFESLLTDLVRDSGYSAVIRGLRNGHDLQYEMNQQYWYEDLGLKVPVVYFITDRKLSHISSSAIRALDAFKKK